MNPPYDVGPQPSAKRVPSRRYLIWEVVIVLALSLGRAAVYAVLRLTERLNDAPLGTQSATIQTSRSDQTFFDVTYQFLDALFGLAPVALVLYLVFLHGHNPFRLFGLDARKPVRDTLYGLGLFGLIGIGTMVIYGVGRAAGVTVEIIPSDVGSNWWNAPLLLLSAVRHSLLEEVIMVAYLFDRFRRIAPQRSLWIVILGSAVLRGCYHLYQGFGPGVGNFIMGIIFGWLYTRYGRVMPLVIAHFLLDAVAFLAFPVLVSLFGL